MRRKSRHRRHAEQAAAVTTGTPVRAPDTDDAAVANEADDAGPAGVHDAPRQPSAHGPVDPRDDIRESASARPAVPPERGPVSGPSPSGNPHGMAAPGEPPAELSAEYWRDVVAREPGNTAARRRLARAYEARGEMLLAVEQLEAARHATPDDVPLIVELAQALTAIRRFDPAERELRRALRLQPENADAHLAMGVISFRRGLYAQAEAELKRALDLDSESAQAYFYRGEALNQLSRVDEALDMLVRSLQLQPSNARAYYVMGILYDKKSQPQEAAAMFRRAREVGGA